jgi:hypothetical protein
MVVRQPNPTVSSQAIAPVSRRNRTPNSKKSRLCPITLPTENALPFPTAGDHQARVPPNPLRAFPNSLSTVQQNATDNFADSR